MDESVENELFDTCAGLGNYHELDGKKKLTYLMKERNQCLTSLLDLDKMLKEDSPESGYMVRQKLGEWQVLPRRIIPLFLSYPKDSELVTHVVQLMVQLTTRVGLSGSEELQHLRHLQDYKEAFSKSDIFTCLLRLVMEGLDNEAGPGQQFFKDIVVLIRNLVSVPDPGPGDSGFTPLRRRLQLTYIRHFHDEGVLDFIHYLGEELVKNEENKSDEVWAVAGILYHICTNFDPQGAGTAQEIDIWSFNLRTELVTEDDLENSWQKRRDGVAALLCKYRPAIVCAQEATVAMLSYLSSKSGYDWKGISRQPGHPDECAGFLFDSKQVELLDHSAFWLRPPGVPDGHVAWDAKLPRTCEVALFKIGNSSSDELKVRVLNTHFDHEGILARSNSAALITDALGKFKEKEPTCPQILCGDFNSPKSSEAYSLLAKELQDVFRSAPDLCTPRARSTIHKWQGLSFKEVMGDGTVDLSGELEKSKDEDTRHIDWILWQNGPTQFQSTQLQPMLLGDVAESQQGAK
eukprot:symbB.v1.2.012189.t2/scaffold835.1/size159100/16